LRSEFGEQLDKHEYVISDFVSLVELTYIEQRSILLELEKTLLASQANSESDESEVAAVESAAPCKVSPCIQLPQFSGKFEDWSAFGDFFDSIVIKEASKVEKLYYLKINMKGDAEQLIRSLPSTKENFERA